MRRELPMLDLITAMPTRRRLLGLAAGGLVSAAVGLPAIAKAELPGPLEPGLPLRFDIFALGIHFGNHRVEFDGHGDQFTATTLVDIDTALLGISLLRYVQQTRETWAGGRLQSFLTEGTKNGEPFRASGRAVADGFELEGEDGRSMAPRDTMLATCWSPLMLDRRQVINPRRGKLKRQTVESREQTTVEVGDSKRQVTRYVVDSVIDGTIYYDEQQTWVAASFDKRGATISYVLR